MGGKIWSLSPQEGFLVLALSSEKDLYDSLGFPSSGPSPLVYLYCS